MDYTNSPQHVTHAGTGNRMHEDNQPIPTMVTDADVTAPIWEILEAIKATGAAPIPFNPDNPASYQQLLSAIKHFAIGADGGFYRQTEISGGEIVLTERDMTNDIIGFAGALTSNATIIVPTNSKKIFAISNQTTGDYILTVKTADGAGLTVSQGKRRLVYVSSVGVYDAMTDLPDVVMRTNNIDKVPVTTCASALFIGDSLTELRNGSSYVHYMIDAFAKKQRGYKQIGYLPASSYHSKYNPSSSIVWTFSAGWVQMWGLADRQLNVEPFKYSFDGKGVYTESASASDTIGLSLSASYRYEVLRVYYLEQVNGGTFTVTFAGQQAVDAVTVNTQGTASSLKYVDIPANPDTSMSWVIGGLVAGKKYAIYGVELLNPSRSGFVYADMARNGIKLSEWTQLDATAWKQYVSNIAPDLVLINIGTNDATALISPSVFSSDLSELYTRIKSAAPNARVILIEPNRPQVYEHTSSDVAASYRAYTQARINFAKTTTDCYYLDVPAALGNWQDMRILGMTEDGVHPNGLGKRAIAAAILDSLNLDAAQPVDTYPDWSGLPLVVRHPFTERGSMVSVPDGTSVDVVRFGLAGPVTSNTYIESTILMSMTGSIIVKKLRIYAYKFITSARGKVDDARTVTVTEEYRSVGAGTPDVVVTVTKNADGTATISIKPTGFTASSWSFVGSVMGGLPRRLGSLIVEY